VFVLILGIIVGTIIVPDKWSERMGTIQTYDQDKSSLGRLNAWATAWNLALDRPLVGGGFEVFFVRGVFAKYAPDPTNVRDVHSIYFEMLGEQGFPGFIIFVLLLSTALLVLVRLKSQVSKETSLQWGKYFPDMLQVSIIGYLVGGAFLGRAYFDLLYQLLAVVCLLNKFVFQQVAEKSRKSATSSGAIIFQPMLPSAGGRRGV
jgi:probable O-glycosylation ligase (exosortase A-associated)